jgi:hypothetical protein
VIESTNILWAGLFFRMGWDVNVKLYATSLQLYFSSLPAQKFQMIKGKHTKGLFGRDYDYFKNSLCFGLSMKAAYMAHYNLSA